MKIGKIKHNINLADEYDNIAKSDELSADILARAHKFEQSCYFLLQAMQKAVRAKIFTKINPKHSVFRDMNKSHLIEEAIKLFVDIISANDETTKTQINNQLEIYIIKDLSLIHI